MNKWAGCKSLALILSFAIAVLAQTREAPPVSTVFAVLTKPLELKTATVRQQLVMRTINDVVVNGEVVIPKGSQILGHLTEVVIKGKDEPQSMLAIVMDKAVKKDRAEINLQAIVAAVAAPPSDVLSSDPTYGMMHSNEPKMVGTGPGSATGTGSLSSVSKSGSTAAVATADLKGRLDEPALLNENSQGVIGYEGISLSWHLMAPPPVSVFSTKGKNIKFEAGTQMLLRMAPPRRPN